MARGRRGDAEEIKRRGLKALVTDGNPYCPGARMADAFFNVSTYDIDGHLRLAEVLSLEIVGVLTVAADVGVTVSALAERLGLRACSLNAAAKAANKVNMRLLTNPYIQNHPWFLVVGPGMTAEKVWKDWNKYFSRAQPCVIKAADNSGSRGMTIVRKKEDLPGAIERARKANRYDNRILVEELLSGPEIAVDTFIVDGEARVINVAERYFHRPGVEAGHVNPGRADDEIEEIASEYAKALGVTEGPFKLDLINDPRYGWVVLETATRLSGGFDHMYTAKLGPRKDITGFMLDYAIGERLDWRKVEKKRKLYAACYSPELPGGKLIGLLWNGQPELPDHVFVRYGNVGKLNDSASRKVFVIDTGETGGEAWTNARRKAQALEAVYASGMVVPLR